MYIDARAMPRQQDKSTSDFPWFL